MNIAHGAPSLLGLQLMSAMTQLVCFREFLQPLKQFLLLGCFKEGVIGQEQAIIVFFRTVKDGRSEFIVFVTITFVLLQHMMLSLLHIRAVIIMVWNTYVIRNLQVTHPCHHEMFLIICFALSLLYRFLIKHVEETMEDQADARS